MSTHRKLRLQALITTLLGTALLVLPSSASATTRNQEEWCGVCYPDPICGGINPDWQRDCDAWCDGGSPSQCTLGIPGYTTCDGSGPYSSFVYCWVQ
jgi:hypothetical protein